MPLGLSRNSSSGTTPNELVNWVSLERVCRNEVCTGSTEFSLIWSQLHGMT